MIRTSFARIALASVALAMIVTGLAAPAQAEPTTGAITGRFVDRQGNGLTGYVVAISDTGTGSGWGTLDDGYYSVDVDPGDYRVAFDVRLPDGEIRQYAFGRSAYHTADLIAVAAGATVTVNDALLPTARITGRFVDSAGNPVPVAVTASSDEGGSYHTWTDNGGYSLLVTPGTYRVSFDADLPSGRFYQLAYGKTDQHYADQFEVGADATITVNDTLLPTGTISGRFTDRAGNGLPDIEVGFFRDGEVFRYAHTDADGRYRSAPLPTGTYTVQFQNETTTQFAYGKSYLKQADTFPVTADRNTVVDDSLLPTGTLRVTAIDGQTGEPVTRFEVAAGRWGGFTTTGELLFDLPIGTHTLNAGGHGYSYLENAGTVHIEDGKQTSIKLVLRPVSRIDVKVVDATTGAPLSGVCVVEARPQEFRTSTEWCWEETMTDANGKALVVTSGTGWFQLFAFPTAAPGYGAQWVGAERGTGRQLHAQLIKVEQDRASQGPVIKLDRAGGVTGQVRKSDGTVANGCAVWLSDPSYEDAGLGEVQCDENGRYTIDTLGPYEWPLRFGARDEAGQFGGGTGNRHLADHIQITSGQITTYDFRFRASTLVTVKVSGSVPEEYDVETFNAVSGDIQASVRVYLGGPAGIQLRVIGPQLVKFRINSKWCGGASLNTAKGYYIPPDTTKTLTVQCG